MLLPTNIVALVLISAIDGAVQHKSHQQAGVGNVRRGYSQRSLTEDLVPTEEVKGGQRQTMGYNYPGQNGYNYVAVGADGEAEVAFKLDLSLLMQKLDMIPELQQIVMNLVQKVDRLIYYSPGGGGVIGGGGGGGGGGGDIGGGGAGGGSGGQGLVSQIIALEQLIISRMEQQDAKINALYQVIQQLQGELGGINQEISQILSILQNSGGGGGGTGGSGVSGGTCPQQIGVIEGMIRQMMNTLTQVIEMIERSGQGQGTGGLSQSILEIVQQNYRLLQQCTAMLDQIGQQFGQPSVCPQTGGQGTAAELQILQEMGSIMALIEKVPQQILIVLQNSGLLGGSNGALMQYLQQIMQICESIRGGVIAVRNTLIESGQEIRRHFAESQKSLVAVKKVVTETTEMVQSSAAAAISASRSLKCPSKTQRSDLDGE